MGVRPLHDRVFVKRIDTPDTTKGGIIIPDSVAEKPLEGEIFAVGTGTILPSGKIVPLSVKKGDRVLFAQQQYGENEVTVDGEEYIILDEREILVVIES